MFANVIKSYVFIIAATMAMSIAMAGCTSTGEIPDLKTAQRAQEAGDIERAKVHYMALAQKGYDDGVLGLAKLSLSGKNTLTPTEREALQNEIKKLSTNSSTSLITLAELALAEKPTQKAKALNYYKEAFQTSGDNSAKLALKIGDLYADIGKMKEAITWYKTAYKAGDEKALYRIGRIYEKGMGGGRNFIKALSYYLIAKEQGSDLAIKAVDRASLKLSPADRAKAVENSISLKSDLSILE